MRRLRWCGVLLSWLVVLPSLAHGPGSAAPTIVPVLGPIPDGLRALELQLHNTLAPQLVVENPTAAVLEVEDERGRPFLRIGPQGVQADLNAQAWYRSYLPHGIAMPAGLHAMTPPRWLSLRRQPSWGWFDPRLQAAVAESSAQGEKRWSILLRLDGRRYKLSGHFRVLDRPHGRFRARLLSPPELGRGIRLQLVDGQPAALWLENASSEPVTVLGRQGEPVLRITAAGVRVNLLSPTWRDFGRDFSASAGAAARLLTVEGGWLQVSSTHRYAWLEPRSVYPGDPFKGRAHRWQVPLQVGSRRLMIEATTEWLPDSEAGAEYDQVSNATR
jgi:hypothetical protein